MTLSSVSGAAYVVLRSETGDPILLEYVVRDGVSGRGDQVLPMRVSGKVDRGALASLPTSPIGTETQFEDMMQWFAKEWHRVLGVSPTSGTAHFFDLDGTSLAAAQLIAQLRKRYATILIANVYEHPNLAGMALRFESLSCTTQRSNRVVLPTPRLAGLVQFPTILGLLTFDGLQWLCFIVIFNSITTSFLGPVAWTSGSLELS
ncbi:putative Carrier domain-containing protein [Seiridium unicorne]|uniref:Carrier domain-containing protein n=1 Tax=Seiridium unicorne TaxID=138068 RepID=A0ABR2V490_9PEZI